MATETRAELLFQKLTSENALQTLMMGIESGELAFEDEWLEFKAGKIQEKDLPRILSKSVSAFANNEGGVLIWGVDARKDDATGVDKAHGLSPVSDILRFKSRLMELAPFAVDPPLKGMRIEHQITDGNGGLVMCFIPEGQSKPHRAEGGERRFYLRVGGSSKDCSVSLLRQMFYPKASFEFEIVLSSIQVPSRLGRFLIPPVSAPNDLKGCFELSIRNRGAWTIEAPYVSIASPSGFLLSYYLDKVDDKFRFEEFRRYEKLGSLLHPDMSAKLKIALASKSAADQFPLHVQLFAKNMSPKSCELGLQPSSKVNQSVIL